MAVSVPALTDALARIVGTDQLLNDPAALSRHAVDDCSPAWITRPGNVDEVSRLLALASEERLAVVPWGTGSMIGLGKRPRRVDLVVDLRRLAAVLEYEPADLTVTVQCGITLGTLNAGLAEQRQFLPLDPLRAPFRSLGGVLATNASGPLRIRYGTPRDLLLGIRFVQADGTVTWGGAKVVKSVTGYDIPKLMAGSLGTLGVFVDAALRLHPLPDAEATWVITSLTSEGVGGLLTSILASSLQPNRLQIVSISAAIPPSDRTLMLAVSFGSVSEAVRTQGETLLAMARREGGRVTSETPEFWSRPAEWLADSTLVLKVAALLSETPALCAEIQRLAGAAGVSATICGEAGNGALRAGFKGAISADEWDEKVVSPLRARVTSSGGSVVVETAPRELKERLDVWGPLEPGALAIMKGLKAEFDPLGILNPGRFVDGI